MLWDRNRGRSQKTVFIDTSAIIAFINEKESNHEDAVKIFRSLQEQGYYRFISNYVAAEVYALILNRSKKDKIQRIQLAFEALEWLYNEETFAVLFVDQDLEKRTRGELLKYQDKLWSIADMTSFLLMQEYKISYFLSFDNDFNQASHHFDFLDIKPYLSSM